MPSRQCSWDFELWPLFLTINFDDLPPHTALTNQYAGVTFTHAFIGTGDYLFPAHSGSQVAFTDEAAPTEIDFQNPVLDFSGFFTYEGRITMTAFSKTGDQAASATSLYNNNLGCDYTLPFPSQCTYPSFPPVNEFIKVSYAGGISRITITPDFVGLDFALDDASFSPLVASVPEPDTAVLCMAAVAIVIKRLFARSARHSRMT